MHMHDHKDHHDHNEEELITIIDENGDEKLYEILFTFDAPDFNKSYIFLYPAGTFDEDEVEIEAFAYVEDEDGESGTLQAIETDEEWELLEEVFHTFVDEEQV